MTEAITSNKMAWSVLEVSAATGLSVPFLRREIKRGALTVKSFGRRKLILNGDLQKYLESGSTGSKQDEEGGEVA